MDQPGLKSGVLLGMLLSLPVMAISYLGSAIAGLAFLPFDLFDWLARVLPGGLVTLGIDALVSILRALGLSVSETAKLAEQLIAIALFVGAGAALGLLVALLLRVDRTNVPRAALLAAAPLLAIFLVMRLSLGIVGAPLVEALWLVLLTGVWAYAIAYMLGHRMPTETAPEVERPDRSRRDAIIKLTGAAIGLTIGAVGLGRLVTAGSRTAAESGADRPLPTALASSEGPGASIPATPEGRIEAPPGVRPEITSNEDFYRIDINTRPPVIDGAAWQLETGGLFRRARNLTLSDLMSFDMVTQPVTLSCISNRVGGDLIGASYWTGLRLRDLLQELQLMPDAGALYLEAQDGFYETVSAEDMFDERTLLVYGMNGQTLPVEHGFPLRILIPNRYGMKQPKWIVRMEAVEAWRPGYWVERGWSREARPQIVSVIDAIATQAAQDGVIPVAGIAWAGDRGIRQVEVRVDDGPWQEAQLRTPPLSGLTWIHWRYDWPAAPGRHRFTVRATDGAGELQTELINDPHPDGSTGYHSRTATI